MSDERIESNEARDAILALTWFPAVRDAVSGRVSPPRRKTHIRVRDIDAALDRHCLTPPEDAS